MEDVFKLVGKIAIENSEANKNIDDTTKKAESASKKLSTSFENIGKGLKTAGDKITSVGKTMTATLTTGFVGLIGSGIKYNAQMQDFEANLTTLLGSSDKATKLLSDLKEMAATTPYETTDLIDATQTMIGFGISAQDAQKYLGVLGDISMGNSEKLSGLSLAFAQVQSAGKLTGQDLNQMINQGFNPLLYISKMTGKSMATLKEEMGKGAISAEMVAQAFEYATQEGQPFYQSMEKSSQTINGRISTLKDNVNMLVGSLTESLLPTFEKVIDKAIQLTEKFSNLSEEQKEQILKWGAIVAVAGPALIVIGKLITAFGAISTAIGKFTALKSVNAWIVEFIKEGGSVGSLVGGAFATVAGIIALVASVVVFLKEHWDKVTETFQNFIQNTGLAEKFEEIKSKIEPLVEKFKGLKDLFEVVGGIIVAILQPAISILAGLFNGVISAIAPLMDALGGIIDILAGIGTFIKSVFVGDWQGAVDALKQIGQGILDFFGGLWNAIVALLQGFWDGFIGWWKALFDAIGLTDLLNGLKEKISNWWNGIVDWLSNAWNTICNVVQVGFMLVKEIISAAFQIITLPFKFIWENCKETVTSAWNSIKEKVSSGISNVKEKITSGFNAVKTFVQSCWNGIKEHIITPIQNAYNSVKEKVNAIKEAVSSRFNEVKSKVQETWNNIKEKITTPINNAKENVRNTVDGIKSSVSSTFESVKSKVSSTWNAIKEAIAKPINDAKEKVKSGIDSMKSFFNFNWELPKLKMPHFKVSGEFSLNPPKVPSFGIDWYKKAMENPMLLNEPTAFGISPNGNIRVAGEAGSEVVSGTNTLMNMISSAVASQNATLIERLQAIVVLLSDYLPELANMQLVTDTGVLVGEIAPQMDEELGKLKDRKGRGR